jgi:carbon monoxide dehydrogenase subunit G
MKFSRTVEIKAPFEEVWALLNDVPAVAQCIPGVRDVKMAGPTKFTCKLTQRVGSAKANFDLRTTLDIDEASRVVIQHSDGRDRALGSTVNAQQKFSVSDIGDGRTQVEIDADFQITGRIATFGHRIISAKTEQITIEGLQNVDQLLASRRQA